MYRIEMIFFAIGSIMTLFLSESKEAALAYIGGVWMTVIAYIIITIVSPKLQKMIERVNNE